MRRRWRRWSDREGSAAWPSIAAHFDALRAGVLAGGTGAIGLEEGRGMLSTTRMSGAGWGWDFIEKVVQADRGMASGTLHSSEAYWLRDAFFQVARESEPGGAGRWHDAALLYAGIATAGGPPPLTEEMLTMGRRGLHLRARSKTEAARARAIAAELAALDAEARRTGPSRRAVDLAYEFPGSAHAITITMQLGWARDRLAAITVRQDALGSEARQIGVWARRANAEMDEIQARSEEWGAAVRQWREAMGRVLADAEVLRDPEAHARAAALFDRFDRVPRWTGPEPRTPTGAGRRT